MIARSLVTFLAVLLGVAIAAVAFDAVTSMMIGKQAGGPSIYAPSTEPPIDEGQRRERLQFWKWQGEQP